MLIKKEKAVILLRMLYSVYCIVELVMLALGLMCFVALYFIPAGYGKLIDKKWGFSFNNKAAWMLMECPTLIVMISLLCTLDYAHKPDSAGIFFPCPLHSTHTDFPDAA